MKKLLVIELMNMQHYPNGKTFLYEYITKNYFAVKNK